MGCGSGGGGREEELQKERDLLSRGVEAQGVPSSNDDDPWDTSPGQAAAEPAAGRHSESSAVRVSLGGSGVAAAAEAAAEGRGRSTSGEGETGGQTCSHTSSGEARSSNVSGDKTSDTVGPASGGSRCAVGTDGEAAGVTAGGSPNVLSGGAGVSAGDRHRAADGSSMI